ncbi:MAG: hypothetical protein ACD_9C00113G0001, partial [uncultured bacterium]
MRFIKSIIFIAAILLSTVFFTVHAQAATRTISDAGGNWNSTSSWVEGAVPTSADDVVATATSGNLTINVSTAVRSIDLSSYTGTLTHNAVNLSVGDALGGALNFSGSWTYTTVSIVSWINFVSTSDNGGNGWNVITGGKLFGNTDFNGNGGKWLLLDNFGQRGGTLTNAGLFLTQGTLIASGVNLDIGYLYSSNLNTRALDISNSTIDTRSGNGASAIDFSSGSSSLNFTSTNSTINIHRNLGATLFGGGKTFNTVVFDIASAGSGSAIIHDANFTNLTLNGKANKQTKFEVGTSFSVSGTLTLNGNSATDRLLVQSFYLGTPMTITAANVSISNADFRDIIGAGTANWDLSAISGGSGDAGGNSGITFTTAAVQYWKTTMTGSKNWSDVNNWASSSGGAGGSGRVPLPQDDAIFDANSIGATSTTVVADMPRLGKSIDWTGMTNTPTFSLTSTPNTIYGSLTMVAGMNLAYNQMLDFQGRGSYTLTSGGKTFSTGAAGLSISMVGGTLTLLDDLNMSTGNARTLFLNNGTLDANGFNVNCNNFSSNNSNTRSIIMGSGTWTMGNGYQVASAWDLQTTTNLTFDAGNSTLQINDSTYSTSTIQFGGLEYNNVVIGAGLSVTTIVGSNTFNNLTINAQKAILFTSGTTQTINGNFNATGDSSNTIFLASSTPGSPAILSKPSGVVTGDHLSIQDITATGGGAWYAGANSTNVSGNSGWVFANSPGIFYSVGQSTSDLKTGTPTITIIDGAATFSEAQTGNIGVGDRVTYGNIDITTFADQGGGITRITTSADHGFSQYDYVTISGTTSYNGTYQITNVAATNTFDIVKTYAAEAGGASKFAGNIAYISSKSSTSAWNVITPRGGRPTNRSSAYTVNSITHEYTTLAAAVAGASDANHLNTTSLTGGNYVLNVPCYYDTGADNTRVTISGYVTGENNYIKVYAPNNVVTEVNILQRHQGKWDDGRYNLKSDAGDILTGTSDYLKIEGLQIDQMGNNAWYDGIIVGSSSTNVSIYGNIIRYSGTGDRANAIYSLNNSLASSKLYVYNNIMYGWVSGIAVGNFFDDSAFIYNNTIYNNVSCGINESNYYDVVAINNLSYNNGSFDYCTTGTVAINYSNLSKNNLSEDSSAPGVNSKNSTTVSFVDVVNKDFHLSPADTSAKNAGADLSSDPNFAFTTDIDGQTRSG